VRTLLPTVYIVGALPGQFLCFRIEELGGRQLLSLIPNGQEQHPLDVVSVFADDPKLTAKAYEART
jgi:hypothetical protein